MRALESGNDYRHSHSRHQHGPAMGLLNQRRCIRQVPGIRRRAWCALGQVMRVLGQVTYVLITLALVHATVVSADAPAATGIDVLTPTPAASSSVPTPTVVTLAQESTAQRATSTPVPEASGTPTGSVFAGGGVSQQSCLTTWTCCS